MTIRQVNIITDNKRLIPTQGTPEAAGYDCIAIDYEILPLERCVVYDLGYKIQIPKGFFLDLRARSSIYKKGPWMLANGCGVVDPDYQGPIKAVFKCLDAEWDITDMPYELGEKVCQVVLVPYVKMEFEQVKEFKTQTVRGEGGFGSTDKKKTTRKKVSK